MVQTSFDANVLGRKVWLFGLIDVTSFWPPSVAVRPQGFLAGKYCLQPAKESGDLQVADLRIK
jgi:hypothetical protein